MHIISFVHDCFLCPEENFNREKLLDILEGLFSLVEVLPTNEDVIKDAIHSEFTDFEDAVQYHTALACHTDCIVTRNPIDFKHSEIPVLTPSELLQIPYWTGDNGNILLNEPEHPYDRGR